MPELPEVETIVRQLTRLLSGKTISSTEALREKSLQDRALGAAGKRIEKVDRKQKMVVMELTNNLVILVHLKMTGQLIYEAADSNRVVGGHPTNDWGGKLPSKHTRVIIHFSDGAKLYFNDQRMFGWVRVVTSDEWKKMKDRLPPDVVDKTFTAGYLEKVVGRSGRAIKLVILDQAKMGGMGNIYANDALYLARIHPQRKANSLKRGEILCLHKAMREVIAKGIETGGASYSHYVDTKGLGGHYQEHFLVYNQEGKLCQKCHETVIKISIGGRGTYFCPKCQR